MELDDQQEITGAVDPAAARLGAIIRSHRQARGITLRAFARQCDLSPAHVSKVERGLASPSIFTLSRMVAELGIDGSELFRDAPDDAGSATLVRRSEVPALAPVVEDDPQVTETLLLAQTGYATITLARGGSAVWLPPITAPNESVVHVLEGAVEFEVDGELFALDAGDVLIIPPNATQRLRILHGDATRVLHINGSPAGVQRARDVG